MSRKKHSICRVPLSTILGTHWGYWILSSVDNGRLLYLLSDPYESKFIGGYCFGTRHQQIRPNPNGVTQARGHIISYQTNFKPSQFSKKAKSYITTNLKRPHLYKPA